MTRENSKGLRRLSGAVVIWPLFGLGLLLLFNLMVDRGFFEISFRDGNVYGPMITVLRLAVKVMFLAIGMTLVIATGGVDLSVGSTMAIVGAMVASLAGAGQWSLFVLLAASFVVGAVIGVINGSLVSFLRLQPIVATLILMVLGRGVALGITQGRPLAITHPELLFLGQGFVFGIPAPIVLLAVCLTVAILICRQTAVGLFIEAVGENETASRFSGVNARLIQCAVYMVRGLCAAAAALISIADVGRVEPDRLGQLLELDAITAVVVGGTVLTGGRFTLVGSMIGAVLIQALTLTLIRQGMSSELAPVPKALVIVGVCLLQSEKFRKQVRSRFQSRPNPIPAG